MLNHIALLRNGRFGDLILVGGRFVAGGEFLNRMLLAIAVMLMGMMLIVLVLIAVLDVGQETGCD